MPPIDLTYNFFTTPVLLSILAYFIRKWISDTQESAKDRHIKTEITLDKINACLVGLKLDLEKRITRNECDDNHDKLWDRLHELVTQ
jgi:hypothetical protein